MQNSKKMTLPPKKILVTSCKGGVGKSTVSANIAFALAKMGKKVLLCDLDFGNRCLDLILGVEDRIIYDIYDAACGRVPLEKAILQDDRSKNLWFVSAPYSYIKMLDEKSLGAFLDKAADHLGLEYIIMDSPCGNDVMLSVAAGVADSAFIVTMPYSTSIRSAEKTGAMLTRMNVQSQRLIINRFITDSKKRSAKSDQIKVIELIDKTRIRLIGAVPESELLVSLQNEGRLVDEGENSNAAQAFENIARRTTGQNVRLWHNFTANTTDSFLFRKHIKRVRMQKCSLPSLHTIRKKSS